MSYRQTVEDHHKLTYRDNVRMVAQQMMNPLRAAVTSVDASGEAQAIADLLGSKEYQRKEDYSRTNVDNPTPRSRRWLIRPQGIIDGEYLDKETKFDAAMDPTSPLFKNNIRSVERGVFDALLGVKKEGGEFVVAGGGIMGASVEGKRPDTSVALPAGNTIAHGGVGLTTEKLRSATEAMELQDFGLETDDEIFALITPKQKTDLLNLALATKTQLNQFDLEQIKSGKPTTLLGVTWIFSNRVPKNSDGNRLCPIWSKANIVAGFWQDVQGEIWNDPHAQNLPYMMADAYVDAGRAEDAGVRIIECVET